MFLIVDIGSQRTYLTNELPEKKKLQLPITVTETPTVYTFNSSKSRELHSPVTKLRLLTNDGSSLYITVNVAPKIIGTLQGAYFNPEKFVHLLKDISLADSVFSTEETIKIELFVGNDY